MDSHHDRAAAERSHCVGGAAADSLRLRIRRACDVVEKVGVLPVVEKALDEDDGVTGAIDVRDALPDPE